MTDLVVETAAEAANIHNFIITLPYVRKKQPSHIIILQKCNVTNYRGMLLMLV